MKRVIIFHGTGGSPQENWFPWLKNILQERGIEVVIPQFPTPQHQTPENWHAVMEPYLPLITPETVLIGHSLGGAFLLRVMEKLHVQVEMAI
ncbi:alpha/beta fold hydrolase [Candidatus Gracilibacteria bacterium]|nr:alpha/beta fold hydrolase [Candidatus Gracilibacteria bacterium]